MFRKVVESRAALVAARLEELISAQLRPFEGLKPSLLPERAGVYVITAFVEELEQPYYVGRTKNLRNRLYSQHLMGPVTSARLKKYLIASGECADLAQAKQFILARCSVRWIEQEGFRERGAIEGYATALLFPKYGIYEEH